MAVRALRDRQGFGSNLESAVGQASGRVRLGQVCDSFPWPGGPVVDACGSVLWEALLYLCS